MDRIGKLTLLIAVSRQNTPLVHNVLGDEFNLLVCHSFHTAETLLEKDINLVTCGVHFDQGRMFDLLQSVRMNPKLHEVPFLLAWDVKSNIRWRSCKASRLPPNHLARRHSSIWWNWFRVWGRNTPTKTSDEQYAGFYFLIR
jgi:hypothetical protein